MIEVPSIPKVTVSIAGDKLPRDILPPEGTPGSASLLLELVIQTRGAQVSTRVKGKLYRATLKRVDAIGPENAMVHLSGFLGKDNVIEEAGFVIFPLNKSS